MTQDELLKGDFIVPTGPRRLYLVPGEELGLSIPQTMVALDEKELEEYKRAHPVVIEIGIANEDLAVGIEWEVRGIRRLDLVNLPGYLPKENGDHEADV
jgi:hypothetical protein